MNKLLRYFITCCLLVGSSIQVVAREADSPILYINQEDLPLTELLAKISSETGYDIKLIGEWPSTPVSAQLKGISLEAGLKKIIKELGSISHILVYDNDQKTVKIASITPGEGPDNEIVIEFKPASMDETISPPSPSGEPGLTASQLSVIKQKYREKLLSLDQNSELSPPALDQQNLTAADLEVIKAKYRSELIKRDSSMIIEPPSEHGGALTKGDLERFKIEYRNRLAQEGPDTLISEATKHSTGMTRGQLEMIKSAYAHMQVDNDSLVSPPSEHGPAMTVGQLEEHKKAYILRSRRHQ